MNTNKEFFRIGDIPVHGYLVNAPLDGISDSPYRRLMRRLGAALSYTEFINAMDVIHDSILSDRKTTSIHAEERPLGFQIYDSDPDRILLAAQKLIHLEPDFFDINIGCSVARVAGRGAGAGLLREPQKIARIFELMTREFSIPVTAKIRLGWDEHDLNYLSVSKMLEENGAAMIAVHGRTREDGFGGKANWDAIGEIKQHVSIPVIGNGDVVQVSDIKALQEKTGCDAVMIGRAAMANPWIFSFKNRDQITNIEVFDLLKEHLNLMLEEYPEDIALQLFRKYLNKYLGPLNLDRNEKIALYSAETSDALLIAVQAQLNL